jgi:hypothetical protein
LVLAVAGLRRHGHNDTASDEGGGNLQDDAEPISTRNGREVSEEIVRPENESTVEIARCFLRLADVDNGAFERLGCYETALWRQVAQILFTPDTVHPHNLGNRKYF